MISQCRYLQYCPSLTLLYKVSKVHFEHVPFLLELETAANGGEPRCLTLIKEIIIQYIGSYLIFFTTVTVSESLSVTDCLYGSRTMQFLHGFDILVCFQCFMIMIFHWGSCTLWTLGPQTDQLVLDDLGEVVRKATSHWSWYKEHIIL